jgi:hypothetical protein
MENERKQTLLAEVGSFLIDIAKLVFGGVILAGIMEYETINQTILFIIGGVVVFGMLFGRTGVYRIF